jgi:hypothetical protein
LALGHLFRHQPWPTFAIRRTPFAHLGKKLTRADERWVSSTLMLLERGIAQIPFERILASKEVHT